MFEQHATLKKLLLVLATLLVGVVVFAAFSLYWMKPAEAPVPGMPIVKESPEDGIAKQLEALGKNEDGPSEAEIEAQLEALRKESDGSKAPTESEIREQLEKLNQ